MVFCRAHFRPQSVNLARTFGPGNQALVDFRDPWLRRGNAAAQDGAEGALDGVVPKSPESRTCCYCDTINQLKLDLCILPVSGIHARLIFGATVLEEVPMEACRRAAASKHKPWLIFGLVSGSPE